MKFIMMCKQTLLTLLLEERSALAYRSLSLTYFDSRFIPVKRAESLSSTVTPRTLQAFATGLLDYWSRLFITSLHAYYTNCAFCKSFDRCCAIDLPPWVLPGESTGWHSSTTSNSLTVEKCQPISLNNYSGSFCTVVEYWTRCFCPTPFPARVYLCTHGTWHNT